MYRIPHRCSYVRSLFLGCEMVPFRFGNVCIEGLSLVLPELQVSSAELEDRIAPLYERLHIPFGTLERLSGIASRHLWEKFYAPSAGATEAAKLALNQCGIDRKEIKALFNCSVTRDYFEPATACLVAQNLEIAEQSMVMDITNACIGFSDGLVLLSNMIESGVVKAGLIVAAENVTAITEASIAKILRSEELTRDQLLKILPTFTLGCGAVAMVLCHSSIATKSHRILASISRSATQHASLCQGDGDYCMFQEEEPDPLMYTDSSKLIPAAAKLGARAWGDLSEFIGWSRDDVDHIFCHQIGKQVNDSFYKTMGLDIKKEYTVYEQLGNLVSASMPAALIRGAERKGMKAGEKVVLTAFGSGLNAIFTAIEW